MPTYIQKSSSIAASATDENVIKDRRYRSSPRRRVLKAIAATVQDNTPTQDDLTVSVLIGEREVTIFQPGIDRTTGTPVQAEDWLPVNEVIEPNEPLTVKVVNADAAGAHSCRVALSFDGY